MPPNESIIAVPITVEQQGQTRQFLVRLVERLDIVLGYRGNDPYVASSQLTSAFTEASEGLTQLEQTILTIITQLFTVNSETAELLASTVLASTVEAIEEATNALKSSSTVSDADDGTQVISGSYNQTEVQNIQDQAEDIGTQLNALLAALRGTGIIAT